MNVDRYRVQTAKEYSFIVPTGTDLGSLDKPAQKFLGQCGLYTLEQHDVEADSIVIGQELAQAMENIRNEGLAIILTTRPASAAQSNDDGID